VDPTRFDALVRSLTTGGSRRRLLSALSALPLVGTALASHDEDVTAAKGKGKGKGQRKRHGKRRDTEPAPLRTSTEATSCARQCRKKPSKQARRRCRKRCQTPPECTTSADCPAGELCEDGRCIPVPDQCATNTDCDACEQCQGGVCVAQCQPDEVCRNGQCESVQCTTDGDCRDCSRCVEGRCRWQCTETEVCLSGAGGRCCQPRGCPAGLDCGTVDDGCGGQAQCGTCTAPQTCEGSGTPNQCGCTPTTCAAQGAQCDSIGDGCGGTLDCGTCPPAPTICLRSTCAANRCTLEPVNDGLSCDDGDACTTGSTCHNGTCGGGTTICTAPPVCRTAVGATCTGGTCTYPQAPVGTTCDTEPCGTCNGAGRCVGCPPPETCGGGNPGTPGVCGCTPTTCVAQGKNCGTIEDGCGGFLNCGSCPPGQTCGGRGTPNVCGNGQGTCADGSDVCTRTGSYSFCNGNNRCSCMTSVENTTVCADFAASTVCGSCTTSSAQCPIGSVCVSVTGINCHAGCTAGQYACQPICPPAA